MKVGGILGLIVNWEVRGEIGEEFDFLYGWVMGGEMKECNGTNVLGSEGWVEGLRCN